MYTQCCDIISITMFKKNIYLLLCQAIEMLPECDRQCHELKILSMRLLLLCRWDGISV